MTVFNFKEKFEVYTMADKKIHTYFTDFSLDADKNEIMTTARFTCPFDNQLLEYWSPIHTGVIIRGGVFDYEDIFIGVVREVIQNGYTLQITCQNVGRKFKEPMNDTYFETYVKERQCLGVVKSIFDMLNVKYKIDLTGIPDIESYVFDENGSVKFGEDTVKRVPDILQVVDNIKKFKIDKSESKYKETMTIEENEKRLQAANPSVNLLGPKGAFYTSDLMDSVMDKKQDYKSVAKRDKVYGGQYTYEELIKNFCSAVDAHWYVVDTTVYLLSYMILFTQGKSVTGQKVNTPRIEYWMLQDDSFELDVNQYGFYNTVWLEYGAGKIATAQFEDLVRIYDVKGIKYKETGLDKATAQLKAQALLSAHVRDFGMTIKVKTLYSGKFTIASFIKAQNPLTLSESLFLITGMSVSYDAGKNTWIGDLTLSYGPHNPDDPQVPEVGADFAGQGVPDGASGVPGAGGDRFPNSWPCVNPDGQRNCSSLNLLNSRDRGQLIPQEVKNIADQCRTPEQVYNWVCSNISYSSYANSIETVAETIRTRNANCGDQTNLMLAVLYYLGFECGWVWIAGHHYPRVKVNGQWHSACTVRRKYGPRIILGSYPGVWGNNW